MTYISPQVKILKAIVDNGGSATTKQISEQTGLDLNNVHGSGKNLVSRSLAIKRTQRLKQFSPGMVSTWHVRPQKAEKISRMIREAYGSD